MTNASSRVFVTEQGAELYGLMAEFKGPAETYHAAETIRDAGYRHWDVYSPFPIHGIDEAMGIKRTILPVLVACCGFTGAGLGFLMQWYMNNDYNMVVQGKPFLAWEPWIPITFEIGILFSAFAALLGMLALNALPRWHHPLMCKERFLKVSDDRFVIAIEARDSKFDPEKTRELLRHAGATSIELVED